MSRLWEGWDFLIPNAHGYPKALIMVDYRNLISCGFGLAGN